MVPRYDDSFTASIPVIETITEATPLTYSSTKKSVEALPHFLVEAQRSGHTMAPLSHPNSALNRARRWLYVSQAMHQFSEEAWQFCLVLLLAALTNNQSLLLVSTYGVTLDALVAYGTPRMGQMIDRAAAVSADTTTLLHGKGKGNSPRLTLIRQWLLLDKSSVLLATACCWYLFQQQQQQTQMGLDEKSFDFGAWLQSYSSSSSSSWFISFFLLVGIHVLGAMAQIWDKSILLALERDWIVVMSNQYSHPLFEEKVDDFVDRPYSTMGYQQDNDVDSETSDPQAHKRNLNHGDTIKNTENMDHRSHWLTQTNVIMKQIDLACQIAAPALSGCFIAYWTSLYASSSSTSSLIMAAYPNSTNSTWEGNYHEGYEHGDEVGQPQQQQHWNGAIIWVGTLHMLSLIIEWICMTQIYHLVPALAAAKPLETVPPLICPSISISDDEDDSDSDDENDCNCAGHALCVFFCEQSTSVSLGGLGLALLYFNVMTFGGMMTGYLITMGGMSLTTIGVLRGVNSAIGLVGTVAFDVSHRILGYSVEFTGLWSITCQFVFLSISALSMGITDSHWSMVCLIAGVLPSRIGLYAYDITMTTVQQQVKPSVRALVGGTQTSLNAWMELLSFALGMTFSEPRQFHVFIVGGYVAVGLAMVLYIVGVYGVCGRRRDPRTRKSFSLWEVA
jgi:hypothetical protein